MHEIDLRGGYAEMGRQQGLPLRGTPPPPFPVDARRLRFTAQCAEVTERYAPELLAEIDGLVAASEWDAALVQAMIFTCPFTDEDVPSCTVLAVMPERTAGGRTIAGRNFDFFYSESQESATTYRTYPEGRYASLGNCDIWVGREDGLNEAGLFVGQARMFFPEVKPGLPFWLIVRLLLDRCATVDEGLALLAEIPHAASWTYLLADRDGRAAVVEPGPEGAAVRYPEDGLLILTNHAACAAYAGREAFVPPDSRPRAERLRALLGGRRDVDMACMQDALRDHDGLICSHGAHFPPDTFGTIWSVVGCPGDRHLAIAAGHPCTREYRQVRF